MDVFLDCHNSDLPAANLVHPVHNKPGQLDGLRRPALLPVRDGDLPPGEHAGRLPRPPPAGAQGLHQQRLPLLRPLRPRQHCWHSGWVFWGAEQPMLLEWAGCIQCYLRPNPSSVLLPDLRGVPPVPQELPGGLG